MHQRTRIMNLNGNIRIMKHARILCWSFFVFFVIFLSVSPALSFYAPSYAIMPLGDSITQGHGETDENGTLLQNSYRKPLYYMLESDGFQFDFVGSMQNGIFPDPDHEAYGGRTADLVASEIYGWLENNYADIVLLHIGTNDVSTGQTPAEILSEIETILDEIERYDPAITVCVANIINSREDGPTWRRETTTSLNLLLGDMVAEQIDEGRDLVSVDQEPALEYGADAGDLFDTLHPTEQGYAKMADVWLPALENIMGACNPPPLEAGEVIVDSQWSHVSLEGVFTDPVVVANAASLQEDEPAVVRICNVTSEGFDIRIQEWGYLDGEHALETVGYLVVERGQYMLKDGTLITADSFETAQTEDFLTVSLGQEFAVAPVVVSSIITCNDADAVIGRIRGVSATDFTYSMQEEENHTVFHQSETVGYIAWEPGFGMLHEIDYDVGYDSEDATQEPAFFSFGDPFAFSPVLMTSMQTTNESDTASLRWQTKNATGITLFVDEESSLDVEVVHEPETVGYIALSHKSLDPDPDEDGVTTLEESTTYGSDPDVADTDADGLDDGEEIVYWNDHGSSWEEDIDGDGLINLLDFDADNDGEADGTEVDQGSDPADASSSSPVGTTLVFEVGEVILDHDWVHITFTGTYTDPVVIVGPPTCNDDSPAVVRMRNVTSSGCDVRIQEWDYEDWLHGNERAGYLVLEKGKYLLEDGTRIFADSFSTTGEGGTQTIKLPIFLNNRPVVVTCVNTENESDAVIGRVAGVSVQGFEYTLQEEEASKQAHVSETVGYVAWEPSTGSVNGTVFEVATPDTAVTPAFQTFAWAASFSENPAVITGMQTMEGTDPAALRLQNSTLSGVEVKIDEECSQDTELEHYPETIGYIVLSQDEVVNDLDGDGLSNDDEMQIYGTDPLEADTDMDGLNDGEELTYWGEQDWENDGDGDGIMNLLDTDSDNDGDMDGMEILNGTDPEDDTSVSLPLSEPVFEQGLLNADSSWLHVDYIRTYTAPVVVAGPASCNDTAPATVRITNVTTEGFDIRVQEWDYLDGDHAKETIGYLVMERGKYLLEDGTRISAEIFYPAGGEEGNTFTFSQTFSIKPVVVSSVNTENETAAVVGRVADVGLQGFTYTLQEEETSIQEHAGERISCVAWEPSTGSLNGTVFEVGRTENVVTQDFYPIVFEKYFPEVPAVFAGMQTMNGTDPAGVRLQNRTGSGFEVRLDEEQSLNSETEHLPEMMGYMIFGSSEVNEDVDGDGLTNDEETGIYATDPLEADTDGDGLDDGEEYLYWGEESWDADLDSDGLVNLLDPDADNDGDLDGFEIENGTDPADAASVSPAVTTVVFETGTVVADSVWQHVTYLKSYIDPVVVAGPVSYNGTDPSTVRVRNVTPQGFDIRVQEWDYLDEVHALESIGYLVMEKGKYILEDGTRICAQTFVTTGSSAPQPVDFSQAFAELPVVVACVNTENDDVAVTGRIHGGDLYGFDYTLQEQESDDQQHAEETVSCIAWEPSRGEEGGVTFEIGRTETVVTEAFYSLSFMFDFVDTPVILGDMQAMEGSDPAALRVRNTTSTGFEVRVDEDRSADSEVLHAEEMVGYMAFSVEE